MPMPKGARIDPTTGKMIRGSGQVNEGDDPIEEAPEAGALGPAKATKKASAISKAFNANRKAGNGDFQYAVFALYPTGRGFLEMLDEPTHLTLSERYGGGRYEVWKMRRGTGEQVGEGSVFEIDHSLHPPKLPRFQAALANPVPGNPWGNPHALPFGGSQMPPIPGFNGMPAAQVPPAGKVDELEEELEEAEEEIGRLKAENATLRREANESKAALEKERSDNIRAQERAQYEKMINDLRLSFEQRATAKDPLTQLIELKRAETELAGPFGQSRGTDPLQGAVALFELALKAKEKLTPEEPSTGNGSMILELIKTFSPAIRAHVSASSMAPRLPAPPPPASSPGTATPPSPASTEASPAPEGEEKMDEETRIAFKQMVTYIPVAQASGLSASSVAAWIMGQQGKGWENVRDVLDRDTAENFAVFVSVNEPTATDSDEKKAWVSQVHEAVKKSMEKKP